MGGVRGFARQRALAALLALAGVVLALLAPSQLGLTPTDSQALTVYVGNPPPPISANVRILAKLPRRGPGPIRLSVAGDLRDPNGYAPAKLSELVLRLGRGIHLDVDGLPRCGLASLRAVEAPYSPEFDPAAVPCPRAVLGRGSMEIDYSPPGSKPVIADFKLAVLNGGEVAGSTRLFVFGILPIFGPFIARVTVEPLRGEPLFRSLARIEIPQWGNGYGTIRKFAFAIGKNHQREGEAALSGTCAGLRAELSATFLDRPEWGPVPSLSRCLRLK